MGMGIKAPSRRRRRRNEISRCGNDDVFLLSIRGKNVNNVWEINNVMGGKWDLFR